ncbi:hypothetical protein J4450_05750 [Candidatus Micrarchaeota archaeon]|nr:hypothetical protein [Candidatus Micrarchaeota archaeon]
MVEKQEVQPTIETKPEQRSRLLSYNEFRETQRAVVVERVDRIIAQNTAPGKILDHIKTPEGEDIPIIKKGNMAGVPTDGRVMKAMAKGLPVSVINYTRPGIDNNYVTVAPAPTNVDDKELVKSAQALLPDNYHPLAIVDERFTAKEIYVISKVYDCTTFIVDALRAGGAVLNPNVGNTLKAALEGGEGNAIFGEKDIFRGPKNRSDRVANVLNFFSNAHPGDVVAFLERVSPSMAKTYESDTKDKLIWKDGIPYRVEHVALYTGSEYLGSQENEPAIAQAHISSGHIVKESATRYILGHVFDAVAIISYDFIAPKGKPTMLAQK